MWLLDYAVGMLRPQQVAQRHGHPTPSTPEPAALVSAPAGPKPTGEGGGGPASCDVTDLVPSQMDLLTGSVAILEREEDTASPPFGALADTAAAGLNRCEEITSEPTAARPYYQRCHNLPRGHSGRCEPYPSAYRMGVEWHAAMARQIDEIPDRESR